MNDLFRALNDPTRREILALLRERGDLSAGEITDFFEFSKPTISHHLDLLKQAGLVNRVRGGQFFFYSLNMTVLDELMEWLVKMQTAPTVKKVPKKPKTSGLQTNLDG